MVRFLILAPVVLLEDLYARYRCTKNWQPMTANRPLLEFPNVCPRCLTSPADAYVVEKTNTKTVARYIVAKKIGWLELKIPYCSSCARTIERDFGLGLIGAVILGTAAIVGSIYLTGLDHDLNQFGIVLELFLFGAFAGLPLYQIFYHRKRGIVLRSYDLTKIGFKFRDSRYLELFKQRNFRA